MVTPRRGVRSYKLPGPSSLVSSLNLHDVLLGRGSPIIKFEGNIAFRQVVRRRKAEYTATGQHKVKDRIAQEIYTTISDSGGRFLRRLESSELEKLELPGTSKVWAIVEDHVAMEKVKQALRDREPVSPPSKSSQAIREATAAAPVGGSQAPNNYFAHHLLLNQGQQSNQNQSMLMSLLQQERLRQAALMNQWMQIKGISERNAGTPFFPGFTPNSTLHPFMGTAATSLTPAVTPLERMFATGSVEEAPPPESCTK